MKLLWRYKELSLIIIPLSLHLSRDLLLSSFVASQFRRHFTYGALRYLCGRDQSKRQMKPGSYKPCFRSYITSSSSFVKNVMATPCLPARPVRPTVGMSITKVKNQQVKPTNTVHICLDSVCHLEIDDQRDVWHIYTTPSKVRCDEHVDFAIPELCQCSFSLLL
jgi:hypothetical protein